MGRLHAGDRGWWQPLVICHGPVPRRQAWCEESQVPLPCTFVPCCAGLHVCWLKENKQGKVACLSYHVLLAHANLSRQ